MKTYASKSSLTFLMGLLLLSIGQAWAQPETGSTRTRETTVYYYNYPYAISQPDQWTGIALANQDTNNTAEVYISFKAQNGTELWTKRITIPQNGQKSLTIPDDKNAEGWLSVNSTTKLIGLGFFGTTGALNYMADMDLLQSNSEEQVAPHVDQSSTYWNTILFIANQNNKSNWVQVEFFSDQGDKISRHYTIEKNGSVKIPISDFGAELSGFLILSGTENISSFCLYENTKRGNGNRSYSGISSIDY